MAVASERHETTAGQGETWTPTALLSRVGGEAEIARELVRLFINECPRMMEAVRTSVASRSAQEIRRAAHLIKGSVCNFTETGAATAALELECIGREERLDDAARGLARLEQEIETLLPQLQAFEASAADA